jgi:hypothetical protein
MAPPFRELPPSIPIKKIVHTIISKTAAGGPATAHMGRVNSSSVTAGGSAIHLNARVSCATRVGIMIWNELVASFAEMGSALVSWKSRI